MLRHLLFVDSNDDHKDDANTLKETPEIEFSEEIKNTAEISDFYAQKCELLILILVHLIHLKNRKNIEFSERELSRHLYNKNFSLSFSEKTKTFLNFYLEN